MKKNAVGYARYSSDNQREESIDAQVREIQSYAERNNYNIVKIYADSAESARSDDRPAFKNMINDSASGIFSYIIVHKLDRFSRNRYDSAYYRKKLKDNNVRLLSVLENLDDSPESIIMESVLEGMAEYYSANLARETMKGMMENARKCLHNGGTPPFGYDVGPDKKYVVNDHEAIAVRFIFDSYTNGKTYTNIIKWLSENGYKTKAGNIFKETSLNALLMNEKYYGTFVFNRTKRKTSSRRIKSDVFKIPNGVPAIISEQQFLEVKRIMDGNKRSGHKANEVYILTGILKCGLCGSGMVGTSHWNGKKTVFSKYYRCPNVKKKLCDMKAKQKDDVESRAISFYKRYMKDSDKIVNTIYTGLASKQNNESNNIDILEKELAGVEKEISNIVNAIAAGMFHPAMKQKMDELETKKKNIQFQINQEKINSMNNSYTLDGISSFVNSMKDIDSLNDEEKKKALKTFILRVEMQNDGSIVIDTVVYSASCGEPYHTLYTTILK